MFYYKTANGYESRNQKTDNPALQEISQQEYEMAVSALMFELETAEAQHREEWEAEAADLAAALALLGYKEV